MFQKLLVIVLFGFTVLQSNESNLKSQCDDSNATACYMYALPMISGDNAKIQDVKEKGMSFIRKACILGEERACDKMGDNYYQDENYRIAMPYLEKSCARGIKFACEAMGTIFRDGHDIRADDVKSREFYEKACALKSGDACFSVAIIYRGGFGVEKNRAQEKAFYKKGCDAELKVGCDRFKELDNEDKGIETGLWVSIKAWFK